jgi:GT2 family glycosyltransferase
VIAAVVVTHAAPTATLAACIDSIRRAGGVERILVVDNGGHAEVSGGDVEVIRVPNRGYGAAANEGFRRAFAIGASAIALLNDDIVVRAGWSEPLRGTLEQPRVGAAQPKLLIAGSNPPRVNSLGVMIGRDGAGTDIGDGTLDVVVGAPSEIARFTGGAVMFAPEFLRETGGFDERFFLYYEDVDLAARGASLGWTYRLVPTSVVDHERSATTASDPERTWYFRERNRLWHAFRHCDLETQARAVWLSIRRLRHNPRGANARALFAGFGGAPGAYIRRARRSARGSELTATAPAGAKTDSEFE